MTLAPSKACMQSTSVARCVAWIELSICRGMQADAVRPLAGFIWQCDTQSCLTRPLPPAPPELVDGHGALVGRLEPEHHLAQLRPFLLLIGEEGAAGLGLLADAAELEEHNTWGGKGVRGYRGGEDFKVERGGG